jgi:hypothetical protein
MDFLWKFSKRFPRKFQSTFFIVEFSAEFFYSQLPKLHPTLIPLSLLGKCTLHINTPDICAHFRHFVENSAFKSTTGLAVSEAAETNPLGEISLNISTDAMKKETVTLPNTFLPVMADLMGFIGHDLLR